MKVIKVRVSGLYAMSLLAIPFALVVIASEFTKPLWFPFYIEANQDTFEQKLERAKFYDDGGGWVGWQDEGEAAHRARESYEAVIQMKPESTQAWWAQISLARLDADEGKFQQAIDRLEKLRDSSPSKALRNYADNDVKEMRCRLTGRSLMNCI